MRHLLTSASLVLGLTIASTTNGFAQVPDNDFNAADRFTNRDLLENSERDQRLWLSGIVVGMAVGVGSIDTEAGECVAAWYFDDENQVFIDVRANMERFPDHLPGVVVLALARRACPSLAAYRD